MKGCSEINNQQHRSSCADLTRVATPWFFSNAITHVDNRVKPGHDGKKLKVLHV